MNRQAAPAQRGMTLIEMMIAMLIGTVLIAGAITVYTQSKANYRASDSLARLQDNVRFALETLEPDLRLAGYWGMHSRPELITNPNGVVVSCNGGTVAQASLLAIGRLAQPLEARDDVYDLACAGRSPRNGSDVLIVRHASARTTQAAALGAGQVYAEVNVAGGQLFDDAVPPAITAPAELREVVFNAYYVGDSSFEPGVPALRRLSLVDGGAQGALQDQEVIAGVENLQVQFGIDTNGDGAVNRYVDGDNPLAAPGANIVAVRLWMLVRSDNSEAGTGFTDTRVYQPADRNLAPIQPGTAAYPADFRRLAVSKTVFLRNTRS